MRIWEIKRKSTDQEKRVFSDKHGYKCKFEKQFIIFHMFIFSTSKEEVECLNGMVETQRES